MEYLRRKYTILPLEEAMEKLRLGTLPPYTMAITFDAGYANNYTYAFPVLRAHSVPATVYVSTNFVDKGEPLWMDRLEYLIGMAPTGKDVPKNEKIATSQELEKRLQTCSNTTREDRLKGLEKGAGISLTDFAGDKALYAPLAWEECRMMRSWRIAFGAHTKSHPILSRISIYDQRDEIASSRKILSDALGTTSNIFAYPHGEQESWTHETIEALKELGFTGALSSISGVNTRRTDPYELRRISMEGTDDWDMFLLKTSGILGLFSS